MAESYHSKPHFKSSGVEFDFTKEQASEVIRCASDPVYFIRKYIKIIHPDKGLCDFDLYKFQENLVRLMAKERFLIAKIARQSGKTTTAVGYLLWYILNHDYVNCAILANKERTARDILKKLKLAFENLPAFLQAGIVRWNENDIELDNGSKILAAATSPSAIRGGTFNIVFLDEFAFVPDNMAQDFYTSVYPALTAGKTTKIFVISTPNGMNLFHKMWVQATATDAKERSKFKAFAVRWDDVPGRDEEWVAETKANMASPEDWRQEYECEFLGAANSLISGEKLQSLIPRVPAFSVPFTPNSKRIDAGLSVYKLPEKEHIYVATVDVAEGKGKDYSTVQIIDITTMPYEIVACYRNNRIDPTMFPDVIHKMATRYNQAYVLIEINTDPNVPAVLYNDLEYENIVIINPAKANKGQTVGGGFGSRIQLGLKMNAQVKRQGCSTLRTLIENDQIIIPDYDTISELSNFVAVGGTYKGRPGKHDDMVMCLVMFGWLINQQYFKDLTSQDLHLVMQDRMAQQVEEDICPFGIIENGLDDDDPTVVKAANW